MPQESLEDFADRLYRVEKYVPSRRIIEARKGPQTNRVDVEVVARSGESLRLRAIERLEGEFEMALTAKRTQLIRKWHTHDCHRNPGGQHVPGPHEHYPTNQLPRGAMARQVKDMPTHDFYDALVAFLDNCNINILPPIQRGFPLR